AEAEEADLVDAMAVDAPAVEEAADDEGLVETAEAPQAVTGEEEEPGEDVDTVEFPPSSYEMATAVVAAPTLADIGSPAADVRPVSGPPLRPGDVPETRIAVWSAESADSLRAEWHEVKGQFVDEPTEALDHAQALVARAVQQLAETLLAEQVELDPRRDEEAPDTEAMRVAMRRYRDFLDRILAL
ncbi:MAG TPA: hypothetical protein VK659_12280, partial [Asanoa sp.]|nr:hypothetical protein [Asanoa sp.]